MKGALLFAWAATSLVVAESVVNFGQLPACARSQCVILAEADANCVPPKAPITDQGTYQSCLCNSALLVGLKTAGTVCQTAGCSPEDAGKISQYYINLCAGPVVQPQPTTTTAPTTATTTTGTATNRATAGGAAGGTTLLNQSQPSWISRHWKYVVMVVVIAIAMVLFWVGGIYLRRHFDRKRDAKRSNMSNANLMSAANNAPPGAPGMASLTSTIALPVHGSRSGTPVPAGVPQRTRSRGNTLQSLRGNNSRNSLSQPVVWGPHQHQASRSNTPGPSVPPSPVYRNHDAMRSEPHRFANPRAMSPMNGESARHPSSSHGPPTNSGWGSAPNVNEVDRPYTRDVKRRTLNSVQADPSLSTHPEGQAAEICEASPQKPAHL